MTEHELDGLLRSQLKRESVKDAVTHAVELSGRPRREVYARALELAKEVAEQIGGKGRHGEDCRSLTRTGGGVSQRPVTPGVTGRPYDGPKLSQIWQTLPHDLD